VFFKSFPGNEKRSRDGKEGGSVKKKICIVFIVSIVLTLACSLTSSSPPATPQSEKRCGDNICDGPENAQNCPADCTGAGLEMPATAQADDKEEETAPTSEPTQAGEPTPAGTSPMVAEIFLEGTVTRDDGEGTCGTAPWGVDNIAGGDYSCPPPKYWFGYQYEITAQQQVNLAPQGQGWVFQPRTKGGGAYQQANAWSDGNRVCAPVSVEAPPFDFTVSGAVAGGEIVIQISTNPTETASWTCDNNNSYERETTLVQIDMGLALSGDYQDLSVLLTQADRFSAARYRKTFELDTNPSPNPRDHVKAVLTFSCMTVQDDNTLVESACPW
jgi:hypothetical protein